MASEPRAAAVDPVALDLVLGEVCEGAEDDDDEVLLTECTSVLTQVTLAVGNSTCSDDGVPVEFSATESKVARRWGGSSVSSTGGGPELLDCGSVEVVVCNLPEKGVSHPLILVRQDRANTTPPVVVEDGFLSMVPNNSHPLVSDGCTVEGRHPV